jgi:hypothetical protein
MYALVWRVVVSAGLLFQRCGLFGIENSGFSKKMMPETSKNKALS